MGKIEYFLILIFFWLDNICTCYQIPKVCKSLPLNLPQTPQPHSSPWLILQQPPYSLAGDSMTDTVGMYKYAYSPFVSFKKPNSVLYLVSLLK